MTTLDIALSTANNWPNVQSLLNREGEAGPVLWIESAQARHQRWSPGALALLAEHGREVRTAALAEAADHDPALFAQQIQALQAGLEPGLDLRLHLNGGTKWMQAVLAQTFPDADIHYIEGERQFLRLRGAWRTEGLRLRPRAEDILLCYGYRRKPQTLPGPLGEGLEEAAWGQAFVSWLIGSMRRTPDQAEHQRRQFARDLKEMVDWSGLADSVDALDFLDMATSPEGHDLVAWAQGKPGKRLREPWWDFQLQLDWWLGHRCGRWAAGQVPPNVGHLFEKQADTALAPFQSEWGVEAGHRNWTLVALDLPDMDHAELDLLWVLKSGRALVFECKAWNQKQAGEVSTRKDLAARMQNYRRSLGSLAEMVLCLRCDTHLNQQRLDNTRNLVDSLGLKEPLWIARQALQPFRVPGSPEVLPGLPEQMATLRGSLRL